MSYVDGFVLVVPKKNIKAYVRIAKQAGAIWREHGALDYRECIADDLPPKCGRPFPKLLKPKAGETIWFSWILYKSKADRNRVNAKVMKDPRLSAMMDPKKMPFDMKRMSFAGFKVMVEA